MDQCAPSPAVQNELQFLLSLLRISYPGEASPRASQAIEQMLAANPVR